MITLQARVQGGRPPITPLLDDDLSSLARLMWATLSDRAGRLDKRVVPEYSFRCERGDVLAALHELVGSGWVAVRWLDDDEALVAVVSWALDDVANTLGEAA